jgi:hypothetical protein
MGKKQLPDEFKEFIKCLNSKEDLINNKTASAGYIDLADAEKLKKR